MYEEKHQIEFDNIIERIYERQKEIFKNKKYNNIYEFIPKIYYIGLGKTGSSSTGLSFQNENVAHWHSVEYFEKCYQITYLSSHNLDLYDLIFSKKTYHMFFKQVLKVSIRRKMLKYIPI